MEWNSYSLRAALERKVERVSVFKPGPPRRTPIHALRRIWHGPNYLLQITDPALRQTAREVQAEIERVKPEAVLSISGQCVTYLENPGVPVFMFSDTPWLTWHELYAKWDPLPVNGPEYVEAEARAGRRLMVCVWLEVGLRGGGQDLLDCDGVSCRKAACDAFGS